MNQPLPAMRDFSPLPGLTRMETIQREVIRYALRRFPSRFKNQRGARRKVAEWLGISHDTLYRRLKLFERQGSRIEVNVRKYPRKPTGKHCPGIKTFLKRFGIHYPTRAFWLLPKQIHLDTLREANRIRMAKIRREHPDVGGNAEEAARTNDTWRAIKRQFAKHGTELC